MHDQIIEDIFFILLYAAVTATALIASFYLLFRRANAIAPDVMPPVRLRRWAAAFLATMVLGHLWWLLIPFYYLADNPLKGAVICIVLDCVLVLPTMTITLLTMLQDRRRPLWLAAIMILPVMVSLAACLLRPHDTLEQIMPVFRVTEGILLMLYLAFFIYMIFAVRQYGKWLRDNYADLEYKEVWQSIVILVIFMLVLFAYWFDNNNKTLEYLIQGFDFILIGFLLWRVETLQQLEGVTVEETEAPDTTAEPEEVTPSAIPSGIGQLLERRCEEAQLYLQHDLSLSQLSQTIGTNHYYLSQYFTQQGLTYNAYINGLRIRHFIHLYHEAVAARRTFTAQQLANESGFRSYSTFSAAFKQRMGQTVTAWMRNTGKEEN